MSMEKIEEEFDLENFDGSSRRRFKVASILLYRLKRLSFE